MCTAAVAHAARCDLADEDVRLAVQDLLAERGLQHLVPGEGLGELLEAPAERAYSSQDARICSSFIRQPPNPPLKNARESPPPAASPPAPGER